MNPTTPKRSKKLLLAAVALGTVLPASAAGCGPWHPLGVSPNTGYDAEDGDATAQDGDTAGDGDATAQEDAPVANEAGDDAGAGEQ